MKFVPLLKDVVGVIKLAVVGHRDFDRAVAFFGDALIAGVGVTGADGHTWGNGRGGRGRGGLLGAVDDGLVGVGEEGGGRGEQREQKRVFHYKETKVAA